MNNQNCLIIAGEKSGEEHCLSFLPELQKLCPNATFWGVGGDEMKKVGFEIRYHLNDFSSWGVSEVISKIPFYIKALGEIEKEVELRQTKMAILIDFQDFNLRLAKRLKKKGVKVMYYVAPQAWAWKAYRAQVLEKTVHSLFTIIPFEKEWFEKRGVSRVKSIAHPLMTHFVDELKDHNKEKYDFKRPFRLLLLPGSRNFEVKNLLPLYIEAVKLLSEENYKFELGIVKSPSVKNELFNQIKKYAPVEFSNENLSSALKWADFSFAASGTVTLACALFQVPTIICYKSSLLNEYIFRTFLSYNGPIGLANIVHEQYIFPELVQEEASEYNIVRELKKWMFDKENYRNTVDTLSNTKEMLKGEIPDVSSYFANILEERK